MKTVVLIIILQVLSLKINSAFGNGASCEIDSKDGTCLHIKDCPKVLAHYQKYGIRPQLCDNKTRSVCCPTEEMIVPRILPQRISLQKCQEYSTKVYNTDKIHCGHTSIHLIVGGQETSDGEFPHMALIGFEKSSSDFDYVCGGSLISEKFVLSAAHCSYSAEYGKAKYVKLGNVTRGVESRNVFKYVIKERYKYLDYNAKSIDNDIVLFELEEDVTFNSFVVPICLPYINEMTNEAIATGWGTTGYGTEVTNSLLKVLLTIFKEKKCQDKFPLEGRTSNGIDYDSKICAGSLTQSKDACGGDSGGPLQVFNIDGITCMYTIIGVTSYGHANCGAIGVPGVYTRVFKYLDWIEGIVWK